MSTPKSVIVAIAWALSLIGVSVWAQNPGDSHGGTFGMVYPLANGLTAKWHGHADVVDGADIGRTIIARGHVTIALPDTHFVLLADEAVLEPTMANGRPKPGEELQLQGNVRLKLVRP